MIKPGTTQTLKCKPLMRANNILREVAVSMWQDDAARADVENAIKHLWKAIEKADPKYVKIVRSALKSNE